MKFFKKLEQLVLGHTELSDGIKQSDVISPQVFEDVSPKSEDDANAKIELPVTEQVKESIKKNNSHDHIHPFELTLRKAKSMIVEDLQNYRAPNATYTQLACVPESGVVVFQHKNHDGYGTYKYLDVRILGPHFDARTNHSYGDARGFGSNATLMRNSQNPQILEINYGEGGGYWYKVGCCEYRGNHISAEFISDSPQADKELWAFNHHYRGFDQKDFSYPSNLFFGVRKLSLDAEIETSFLQAYDNLIHDESLPQVLRDLAILTKGMLKPNLDDLLAEFDKLHPGAKVNRDGLRKEISPNETEQRFNGIDIYEGRTYIDGFYKTPLAEFLDLFPERIAEFKELQKFGVLLNEVVDPSFYVKGGLYELLEAKTKYDTKGSELKSPFNIYICPLESSDLPPRTLKEKPTSIEPQIDYHNYLGSQKITARVQRANPFLDDDFYTNLELVPVQIRSDIFVLLTQQAFPYKLQTAKNAASNLNMFYEKTEDRP
jgi:hypothetical protein